MRRKVYDTGSNGQAMNHQGSGSEETQRVIKKLQTRVSEMENDMRVISSALPVSNEAEQSDSSGAANRDMRWHCKKCGYLLAFYDKDHDVMRTRYKEHIVYMRAGIGGFIQIVCRGCSEVNTQEYVALDETDEDAVT